MIKLYQLHLLRAFALGSVPVLVLLLALFGFLLLGEALEDVGSGSYGTTDALLVTALRMPALLVELLPVAVLMGGLLGLGGLANHQELIALRAAGLSTVRISAPVIAMLLLLVGALALLQFYAIPVAERSAATVAARALDQAKINNEGAFWTRSADQFLRVNQLENGRTPVDIEIFEVSASGQLRRMIQAARTTRVGVEEWIMQDAVITTINGNSIGETRRKVYRWQSFVDAKALTTLILPASALTPTGLRDYIADLDANQLSSHQYRVMFWQQLGRPLGVLAMGLLALAFVQGSMRTLAISTRLLIGTIVGIAFYLIEQSSSHLAVLYELNPALAALLPEATLLGMATVALMRAR